MPLVSQVVPLHRLLNILPCMHQSRQCQSLRYRLSKTLRHRDLTVMNWVICPRSYLRRLLFRVQLLCGRKCILYPPLYKQQSIVMLPLVLHSEDLRRDQSPHTQGRSQRVSHHLARRL